MKQVLLLAALALARNIPENPSDRIVGMITRYGYPAQATSVTTRDGYILQLIRIPYGKTQESTFKKGVQKPAVLLMHGFMSSAEDWIYGGPTQSLALYLADQGYDVYLGSARGSLYGRQHTTLNPDKDAAFWRFCWHDIGTKDLPALIQQVRTVSRREKINFVGHMEASTAFYVMASEMPEYNKKISKMVSLGPIAFMKKSPHPVLEKIVDNIDNKAWIMKNIGTSTFKPSDGITEDIKRRCMDLKMDEKLCSNNYFMFNGYNSDKMNKTTIQHVLDRVPSGGSAREVIHFAHLKQTGRFETYNFEQPEEDERREYDLSKITIPVSIFYTPDDMLSHVDDVKTLIDRLPNVYRQKMMLDCTNNMDMLYRRDIRNMFDDVEDSLDRNVN